MRNLNIEVSRPSQNKRFHHQHHQAFAACAKFRRFCLCSTVILKPVCTSKAASACGFLYQYPNDRFLLIMRSILYYYFLLPSSFFFFFFALDLKSPAFRKSSVPSLFVCVTRGCAVLPRPWVLTRDCCVLSPACVEFARVYTFRTTSRWLSFRRGQPLHWRSLLQIDRLPYLRILALIAMTGSSTSPGVPGRSAVECGGDGLRGKPLGSPSDL